VNETFYYENDSCAGGLLLPKWLPTEFALPELIGRACVFFIGFLYMLLGMSLITDRFIEAIEVRVP
jgi:hypothetical protein